MKGYLLDTNIPSEMRRIRPEPRVIEWLKAANDNEFVGLGVPMINPWES